jgi:hypothetical protein
VERVPRWPVVTCSSPVSNGAGLGKHTKKRARIEEVPRGHECSRTFAAGRLPAAFGAMIAVACSPDYGFFKENHGLTVVY